MNKIILTGRAVSDIELKQTSSAQPVAAFTIAVPRRSKDKATDFIDCVAWDKNAETASRYIHKGDRFGVVGSLIVRYYEKNGKKTKISEVKVDEIDLIETKKEAEQKQFEFEPQPQPEQDFVSADQGGDLPF